MGRHDNLNTYNIPDMIKQRRLLMSEATKQSDEEEVRVEFDDIKMPNFKYFR
jgi:hypothetical protein